MLTSKRLVPPDPGIQVSSVIFYSNHWAPATHLALLTLNAESATELLRATEISRSTLRTDKNTIHSIPITNLDFGHVTVIQDVHAANHMTNLQKASAAQQLGKPSPFENTPRAKQGTLFT